MAFCPKCGAQVEENVLFCANCGNRLAAPVQPAYQPGQPPVQPPVQPVYQAPAAPSKLGLAFRAFFTKCFVSPIEAAETSSDISPVIGLIFAGSYALIAFFLMMIHAPLGDLRMPIGYRTLLGLSAFLMILASIAARAGIGFAFGRKNNPGVSFLNLISRHAMLKLYPFCAFFLMFLFGIFSIGSAIVILACGELIWTIFSILLLVKYLNGVSDTKKTWVVVLATFADFGASLICFMIFYYGAMSGLMRYLF